MNRPVQPALFPDAPPRPKGVMPDGPITPTVNGLRPGNDPRAQRGKRALSKDHAYHDRQNREAAEIILTDPVKYAGLPVEWANRIMEKYSDDRRP